MTSDATPTSFSIPQPSEDPNDPLNWPKSKKLTVLGITCMGAIFYASVVSAMLNPAFGVMAVQSKPRFQR